MSILADLDLPFSVPQGVIPTADTTAIPPAFQAGESSGPVALADHPVTHIVIQGTMSDDAAVPDRLLLGSLQDAHVRLIEDIPLSVQRDDTAISVTWDAVGELGYGATLSEAIDDFRRSVIELFLELREREDALGPDLRNVLDILNSTMRPTQ
jgi:hypothetical protein